MVVSLAFTAALLAGASYQLPPQAPPPTQAGQQSPATELEAVTVEGQRAREAAEAFVQSVAAPVPGRKAALWRDTICIGVGGMQPDAARFMVDRVSDWAHGVGLLIQPPGCEPDIFIVATADGDTAARELVASRPRDFRTGVSQSDQGAVALRTFQNSGRPIRWWHVSLAVSDDTGVPIQRLPGQAPFVAPPRMKSPSDFGTTGMNVPGSRLTDHSRDDLMQAIIILDTAALDHANFVQITDYVAMVALAQIDPDTEPAQPSILRLFDPASVQEETLTRWDQAYLQALYRASQTSAGSGANLSTVAAALARQLERGEAPADDSE